MCSRSRSGFARGFEYAASVDLTADDFTLAAECRTQNQFNKLDIHYENILAPLEFAHFARLSAERGFHEWSRIWLRKIGTLSPGLFEAPKGFSREPLSENICFTATEAWPPPEDFADRLRRQCAPPNAAYFGISPMPEFASVGPGAAAQRTGETSYLEGLRGSAKVSSSFLSVSTGSFRPALSSLGDARDQQWRVSRGARGTLHGCRPRRLDLRRLASRTPP